MSDTTIHPDEPARGIESGTLKKIGIIALIVAMLVVAWGVFSRQRSDTRLAEWTQDQTIPTVDVIKPMGMVTDNALVLPGTVQAFNSAPLYARTNGYVRKWFVDIGSKVKAGQTLAIIDTPEVDQQLVAARAELQTAKANEALASTTSVRWATLLRKDAVSKQETDEKSGDLAAKKAVTNAAAANVSRLLALQGFSRIVAPFDGVVTSRSTQIGQLVTAGAGTAVPLFTVSDVRTVRIYVRVPQAYRAGLRAGLKATMTLPEYPGRSFDIVMARTADAVDQQSGSELIELQAQNADAALSPGAYAQIKLPVSGTNGSVVVPASAILYRSDGTLVATVGADNKATLHKIQIGRDMGDTLEVTAGVKADDKVIDSPPDSIRTGDTVRISGQERGASHAKS
ncbi:efflux RND transporter periplasmic adaptor subunit [Novosphingobium terrae]|uniref:efflux RND transporter periplasmic adaptor subunit n=1 Tax=Novosphingobium terrae TaxID=2726189 RepID=UPI00197E0866|nr:efflux RND transporter periplasmic adaptor subunit [Novosphingobium terrae]